MKVDHSVGARDKLHESEARWASMFCFDNPFPEKSFFVDDLVCFASLYPRDFVFLNATRTDRRQSKTLSGEALLRHRGTTSLAFVQLVLGADRVVRHICTVHTLIKTYIP